MKLITKDDLLNSGWHKDGLVWISPYNGECLSMEQARWAEAEEQFYASQPEEPIAYHGSFAESAEVISKALELAHSMDEIDTRG